MLKAKLDQVGHNFYIDDIILLSCMEAKNESRIIGILAVIIGILMIIYPYLVGYLVGIFLIVYGLLKFFE